MIHKRNDKIWEHMKSECSKYSGLCCTALFFSKIDGFPKDNFALIINFPRISSSAFTNLYCIFPDNRIMKLPFMPQLERYERHVMGTAG